jgi:hypothetical protein
VPDGFRVLDPVEEPPSLAAYLSRLSIESSTIYMIYQGSSSSPIQFDQSIIQLQKKAINPKATQKAHEDIARKTWLAERLSVSLETCQHALVNTSNAACFSIVARLPSYTTMEQERLKIQEQWDLPHSDKNVQVLCAEFASSGKGAADTVFHLVPHDLFLTKRSAVVRDDPPDILSEAEG